MVYFEELDEEVVFDDFTFELFAFEVDDVVLLLLLLLLLLVELEDELLALNYQNINLIS